jgi:hypothetical protein
VKHMEEHRKKMKSGICVEDDAKEAIFEELG